MAQNFGYNEAFAIPEYNQALVNWLYIACALFAILTFVCIALSMFSVDSKNLKMKWWSRVSAVVTSLVVVFCINAIPAQEDNNEQAKITAIEEHTGLVSIMWHEQEGYFTAVDEGGDYIVAELVEPESGTFVIVPVQP